jgi:Tape measure protein/Lambda phage tail tape-measure protein (Tape_meas_lam_C)
MASETIDTLIIKIQADMQGLKADLVKTQKELDNFSKSVDKQTSFIGSAFKRLGATALAYFSIQTAKQIINVASSLEKLQTSLVSVTGSEQSASAAFDLIGKLALETPFSIDKISESYIRLKSLGIDPTKETLMAFANIAAATSKDLSQVTGAASKAILGEIGALEQFGIIAKKEKGKIDLTYKGVTTTIRDSSENISKYLQSIGNVQYADAAARQADTVAGAFDNLIDSVKLLINELGESGLGKALAFTINLLSSYIQLQARILDSVGKEYNAQDELNKAIERRNELQEELNVAVEEADGEYSSLAFNLQDLLKAKNAEIVLLRADVDQQNEGTEAKKKHKEAVMQELKEIDKALIPKKRYNDLFAEEIKYYKELGLTDAELMRRDLAKSMRVLNIEQVKGALSADEYARASDYLKKKLKELSTPLEFISKSEFIPRKRLNTTAIEDALSAVIPREKNELDNFAVAAASLKANLISLSMSGIGTLEDSMLNLINGTKSVKESFRDMANSILNDIIRMTLRQQISAPIAALLGNFIGNIGGQIVPGGFPLGSSLNTSVLQRQTMDYFTSNINLGRAGGGSVSPNLPYMVGERGAELFVPNTPGRIVNNAGMKSMPGGNVVVNQNINISAGVAQTVRAEMYSLLPQIKLETLAAINNRKLRTV